MKQGPSTGFLSEVRRPGKFALLEANWGPDYADPSTYTEPFSVDGTYNKPELAEGYKEANGQTVYLNLLEKAKATIDTAERYNLFAQAEAFLIEEAFVTFFSRICQHKNLRAEIYLDDQTGLQARNIAPNAEFWFGTNSIGQDLWSANLGWHKDLV
ncbi:hypothetical protein LSPH24S_08935 [Lysinibacillus sphaericus]